MGDFSKAASARPARSPATLRHVPASPQPCLVSARDLPCLRKRSHHRADRFAGQPYAPFGRSRQELDHARLIPHMNTHHVRPDYPTRRSALHEFTHMRRDYPHSARTSYTVCAQMERLLNRDWTLANCQHSSEPTGFNIGAPVSDSGNSQASDSRCLSETLAGARFTPSKQHCRLPLR